jgi:hypothetical protein
MFLFDYFPGVFGVWMFGFDGIISEAYSVRRYDKIAV